MYKSLKLDENEYRVETFPADILGEGWMWKQFDDGSGYLQGPNGETLFSYDLAPYNGKGVEYRQDYNSCWNVFWGSFGELMRFAEEQVGKR